MRKSLILLAAVLFALPAALQADPNKEADFKAEFIINLIDNIELSEDSKLGDNDEIVISVVGECPVYDKLVELAQTASEKGRNVTVQVVSENDDLASSHILYLPTDDLSVLAKVLKKLNGSHTVTVADAKDFARYGAMINFYEEEGKSKVHYEVNKLVVDSAGITLSSKVLDKAELI